MTAYSYSVAFSVILVVGSLCVGVSIGYMCHGIAKLLYWIIAKIRRENYKNKLIDAVIKRSENTTYDKWY